MAGDRHAHYGGRRGVLGVVARGPVPRDLSAETKNARSPEAMDVFCSDRCVARDRPSPYGGRRILARRGTGPRPTVQGHGLDSHVKKKHIKVLQTLAIFAPHCSIDIKVLQT